jgi:hypothetical protein
MNVENTEGSGNAITDAENIKKKKDKVMTLNRENGKLAKKKNERIPFEYIGN